MHQQADNTPHQQLVPFKWSPGKSGNPKGRPKGARNKLSEQFCLDMFEMWAEYGPGILKQAALKNPVAVCQMVASMMPRDFQVKVDTGAGFRTLWEALANGKVPKPIVQEDE